MFLRRLASRASIFCYNWEAEVRNTQQAGSALGRVAARKKPFLSCQREGSFLKPERPLRVPSAHERWRLPSFVPPAYAAVEQARLWTLWADVDFAAITRFLFALFSKTGSGKIVSVGHLQGW